MKVSRKTYKGIKWVVALLALALVVTAIPLGLYHSAPKAEAVDATSWADFKSKIEGVYSGGSLTVTVPASANWSAGFEQINVRSGANITVINNGTITMSANPGWYNVRGNMFYVNSGATLNIQGSGTYKVNFDRTGMSCSQPYHELATSNISFVENNGGTVNISSGNIIIVNKLEYNEVSKAWNSQRYGNGSAFLWTTGVWNRTTGSRTNITGGRFDIDSYGACVSSSDDHFGQMNDSLAGKTGNNGEGGERLFIYQYGVYGGSVTMNGGTLDLFTSSWYKYAGSETRRAVVGTTLDYGIFSEDIHMINGKINVSNNAGTNQGNTCGAWTINGTMGAWAAGLAYKSTTPKVDGGTITTSLTNSNSIDAYSDNNKFSKVNYAIVQTPNKSCVSYDPANYNTASSNSKKDGDYPISTFGLEHRWKSSGLNNCDNRYKNARGDFSGVPTAGTAKDSNGRNTTYNNANMTKGQNGGTNGCKNVYVYRYFRADGSLWKYQYTPDSGVNGTNGHVHYVCDTPVTSTSGSVYYDNSKNPGAKPNNTYKWELTDIAYRELGRDDTAYVDLDGIFKTPASSMTKVNTFSYPGASHTFTVASTNASNSRTSGNYVYVFFDYKENAPEELAMTYDTTPILYDGEAITPDDCKLKIWGTRNSGANVDDITSVANASYSYTGKAPNGAALNGNGMPKDAGEYTISVSVPANDSTNRKAFSGTFKINITQVSNPEFSDVSATVTYPETLGSINLDGIISLANQRLKNDFTYTWSEGSDYIPTVAESTRQFLVTCAPKAEAAANYTNSSYTFFVSVTVNPKAVNVTFNSATVEYGEEINYQLGIGLSETGRNIPDGALKTEIINTIKNDVRLNDSASYIPGTTVAGSYSWGLSQNTLNKGNFTFTQLGKGTLVVTKAPLTVSAKTAKTSFPYEAGKTGEQITFTPADVEGVKNAYDSFGNQIKIEPIFASYPNGGNAGTGAISFAKEDLVLSGEKSGCYEVNTVNYSEVEITKANVPASIYQIPSVPAVTYDPMQTLADIAAVNDFSDKKGGGSFRPKDGSEVPAVNKTAYTFIYTPADSANYNETEVQIPLTVEKRVVTVSAAPYSLEYGSEVPANTDYEWTFTGWTADSSAALDGSVFPVLQSVNGKIVKAGETSDKQLGMSGNWETITLTSDYTVTTNAGSAVYINADGTLDIHSDNYEFKFESGKFTVTKRKLVITAPDAEALYGVIPQADASKVEYGNDEHGFANSDTKETVFGNANPVSFVYGTGFYGQDGWKEYVPAADDAGEYSIYPVFANENLTNYELVKIPGTLTVNKRVVTLVPQDVALTYGDEVPAEFIYTSTDASVDLSKVFAGTVNTVTNYAKGSNAGGSYYIKAVCNDDGTFTADQQPGLTVDPNYTVVFGDSAVLTVRKADIPANIVQNIVPSIQFTYSETVSLNEQIKALGKNEVTFEYNGVTVNGEISYQKGAAYPHVAESGNFDVVFTPTGGSDINYNPVTTGLTGYVDIEKAPVSGNLLIGGQLMATGVIYPSTSGLTPSGVDNYNFKWYYVENGYEIEAGSNRTLVLGADDEGKTIKLVATLDSSINNDYYGSVEYTSATKVSPPLDIIQADWIVADYESPVFYDAKPHGATASVSNIPSDKPAYTGSVTVKYNGSEEMPVDAGTYYITVDCSGDSNYAATTAVQIGTLVIRPAEITLDFKVLDKTYDATTKASFPTDEDGNIDKSSIVIKSGLAAEDIDGISLNVNNAKAEFENASAGQNKTVELTNVYLTGDRASNYVLADSTSTATIEKARVTATAKLKTYAVNYSESLTDENNSGVYVYFSNISGVMSRDKSSFRIAEDSVAVINPVGGEYCNIDMNTISAVPNNENYYVEVVNTEVIRVLVNKITPDTAAVLTADVLTLPSRVYDSKANLSNDELRAFIATVDGGKYAADAEYYSWVATDGATPVPQVSTASAARSYYVVFDNHNPNYKTVTFKVRVPVTKREVVIQAANYSILYGADSPLAAAETPYTVISGLYADETLESVFKSTPSVRTSYLKYANVGNYAVTLNVANLRNNNYTVTVKDGNIAVGKVNLFAQATAASKPYDGKKDNIMVSFSEPTGKVRPNDDVYLPSYVYGSTQDANAGLNKIVTIAAPKLEGSAAGNYTLVISNINRITVTVEKLTPTDFVFPDTAEISFGQMLSEAVADGTERGSGKFYYELATEMPVSVGVYQNTYDMIFEPSDSNYESVKQKVTLIVTVANVNVAPVITGSIYVGNTLTANVPGISGSALNYIHYKWYRVDPNTGAETAVGTDSATYTLTSADVNYNIKVVCSFNPDDPYQGSGEAVSSTVKEESLSFWQKIWKWWYQLLAAIKRLFRR